jgi:hypothetical protein
MGATVTSYSRRIRTLKLVAETGVSRRAVRVARERIDWKLRQQPLR